MKQGIRNLKVDNTDHDDDDDDHDDMTTMTIILVMRLNLMMNCLSELNFTKHLIAVYLFQMKNIFYHDYINFVLSLKEKKVLVLFRKLLGTF